MILGWEFLSPRITLVAQLSLEIEIITPIALSSIGHNRHT